MEARYLQVGDVIIKGKKRYCIRSVTHRGRRVILQTDGGKLSFNAGTKVLVD